ncbi:unnamed protein product, partial [Symbiodinium necroappetens]
MPHAGPQALRVSRTSRRRRRQPLPPPGAAEAAARSKKNFKVRRLLAGRTLAVLQSLKNCSLFHGRDSSGLSQAQPLRPAAGLTASLNGQAVLILDVSKKGKAAVATIAPKSRMRAMRAPLRGATHVLHGRTVQHCSAEMLQDVGVRYRLMGRVGDSLYLEQADCGEQGMLDAEPSTVADIDAWGALEAAVQQTMQETDMQPRPALSMPHWSDDIAVVLAQEARDHLHRCPRHILLPRRTKCKPTFILDVPFPRQIDLRPRRCRSCSRRWGRAATWRPEASDVLQMWPDVVHIKPLAKTKANMYATPLFLLTCLQLLYTHLSTYAVRRVLVDVFAASALAGVRQGYLPDPSVWANSVLALPQPEELRCMALQGFANFVDVAVTAMKKRQAIYNMAGIRGDAHYDLASRVRVRNALTGYFETPYSAIQAWCGLDGSLLKPWVLCDGESFETQASDLRPYLEFGRDTRLAYGLTLPESRPVFHCTDSYNKHRQLWPSVYDAVWLGQTLQLQKRKGDKITVSLDANVPPKAATIVTGDPRHDCINLRRALSNLSYDFADAYHDHEDIMNRLSAPPRPAVFEDGATTAAPPGTAVPVRRVHAASAKLDASPPRPPLADDADRDDVPLSAAAQQHLLDMLTLRNLAWRRKWARRPGVTEELKQFLQQPHVLDHKVWRRLCHCQPPRGVGARLARRLDVSLHPTCGFWNFTNRQELRSELARQRQWYKRPRKLWRPTLQRRRRIMRDRVGPATAVGPRSVLTQKVCLHYKRLKNKIRIQGLWHWRKVALQLHAAGLPIHSGTVSVERLWATAQLCFPPSARFIGEAWFQFVSQLAFLKINYSIFHRPSLPGWARTDAQLAEKVDALFHAATELVQSTASDTDVLPSLAAAFKRGPAPVASNASSDTDSKPLSVHRRRCRNFPDALQEDILAASSTHNEPAAPASLPDDGSACKRAKESHEPGEVMPAAVAARPQGACNYSVPRTAVRRPVMRRRSSQQLRPEHVPTAFKRMLWPVWSEALVAGQKFLELQRYERRRGNLMRCCQEGTFLVFGPTGFPLNQGPVHGFAEVAKLALGQPAEALKGFLQFVAPHLRPELARYMADAKYFDAVQLRCVYDARGKNWTWQDFLRLMNVGSDAPALKQSQGFPALGGDVDSARIQAFCEQHSLPILQQCSWESPVRGCIASRADFPFAWWACQPVITKMLMRYLTWSGFPVKSSNAGNLLRQRGIRVRQEASSLPGWAAELQGRGTPHNPETEEFGVSSFIYRRDIAMAQWAIHVNCSLRYNLQALYGETHDCCEGTIFVSAREGARGSDALPFVVCRTMGARPCAPYIGEADSTYGAGALMCTASTPELISWSLPRSLLLYQVPTPLLKLLADVLAHMEAHLRPCKLLAKVRVAVAQVSSLLAQYRRPGTLQRRLDFVPCSRLREPDQTIEDFAEAVMGADVQQWLQLPQLPPVQLRLPELRALPLHASTNLSSVGRAKVTGRLPESLCIIARCLRDVMAADLKIAPVTCVQKVVLHTDKIVFALEAREDLPASHFKHYVVWAAPLQDLCDCHEDDDRWSLGRLHVVQSSSVDNAKFKLDPPLSTKEPAGEHWLLVFVAGIQARRMLKRIVVSSEAPVMAALLSAQPATAEPTMTQRAAGNISATSMEDLEIIRMLRASGHNPIVNLRSGPGCGKSFWALQLLKELCRLSDHHVHVVLAPTRRLRDEFMHKALQAGFDLAQIWPVGKDETGEDHWIQHQFRIIERDAAAQLQQLRALEHALELMTWDSPVGQVRDLLQQHHAIVFAIYRQRADASLERLQAGGVSQEILLFYLPTYLPATNSAPALACALQVEGRVLFATYSWWLKFTSGESRTFPLLSARAIGVVFADEIDEELVTACDPGQRLFPVTGSHQSGSWRSDAAPANTSQAALDALATGHDVRLTTTRRFGQSIVALLQTVLPEHYGGLSAHNSSPNTALEVQILACNDWTDVAHSREGRNSAGVGAVMSKTTYLLLLQHAQRLVRQHGSATIYVAYAALRDLLAQRSSERAFAGALLDSGKFAVGVSRCKESLVLLVDHAANINHGHWQRFWRSPSLSYQVIYSSDVTAGPACQSAWESFTALANATNGQLADMTHAEGDMATGPCIDDALRGLTMEELSSPVADTAQ